MNVNKDEIDGIKNKDVILFGISGKIASGKDTIGNLVSIGLEKRGYKLKNTSFGYIIRKEVQTIVDCFNSNEPIPYEIKDMKEVELLAEILGNNDVFERSENSRQALQYWGTEVRRKENSEYWILQMERFLLENLKNGFSINVTDARFPNEVDLILNLGGHVSRLEISEELQKERVLKRDNIEISSLVLRHVSERALDDYPFTSVYDGSFDKDELSKRILKEIMNH